jgi:hypothetical protein
MAMLPNPLPKLAADPTGGTLGLRLPPGTLVDATGEDAPWHEPLLWIADEEPSSGVWESLLPARSVGLHPVLIDVDRGDPARWELLPAMMSYPGDHDAEDVLAEYWSYAATEDMDDEGDDEGEDADDDPLLAPYGREWPGLAPAGEPQDDPDARAAEVSGELIAVSVLDEPRAALVHARRSADIPAAIGWCGPLNHENDVARLCAVLRSWEDRFGIRVTALGFDVLTVSVASPPRTIEEAEAVAAEHYAFCPDNITQGDHDTLREYAAKAVLNRKVWHFWWD